MTVAAMGGQEQVLAAKIGADARRDRLLPDGGVDRAQHQPLLLAGDGLFLEGTDAPHQVQEGGEPLAVEIGW